MAFLQSSRARVDPRKDEIRYGNPHLTRLPGGLTIHKANHSTLTKFTPRQVLVGLSDVKSYLDALVVAAFGLGVAAFGLFMPTFIKEFGFSPRRSTVKKTAAACKC
jgi:hypothetical protein